MKTHKLVVNEAGDRKTFYTVALNTEMACEKVRRYLSNAGIDATIETCAPKDSITIVETVADSSTDESPIDVGF